MAKTKTYHAVVSKPFVILFLLALLLGLLYFAQYLKALRQHSVPKALQIAAEVDFDHETGEFDPSATTGEFLGQNVLSLEERKDEEHQVLGENSSDKHIEVDLTQQRLYAFEGDHKVFDFLISSGKWGRTPTGTFTIWTKLRYTKMSGGSKEKHTYYYLPNVPYVMFFSNNEVAASRGFSIHGTYWHNNFGHPMSHGCINMKTEEAEQIYYWANPTLPEGKKSIRSSKDNPGTQIIIYGEAPEN